MRLPLMLLGILLLAAVGLLILWVPAGQTVTVDLPVFGAARPGVQVLLTVIWLATTVAVALVMIDGIRFSRWFRVNPKPAAPQGTGFLGWLFGRQITSGFGLFLQRFQENGDLHPLTVSPVRETGIAILLSLFAAIAVALGHLSLPRALVLVGLLTTAVAIAIRAVAALERDPVELRSSWGGLGGGLGGWRLSRSAVLLLLTLALIGAAATAALQPGKPDAPHDPASIPPAAVKP